MLQVEAEYWLLVERLMRYGWYRGGADLERDPSGHSWHFHEGHTRDDSPRSELWIAAPHEVGAMRILLAELQRADVDRRTRSSPEDG